MLCIRTDTDDQGPGPSEPKAQPKPAVRLPSADELLGGPPSSSLSLASLPSGAGKRQFSLESSAGTGMLAMSDKRSRTGRGGTSPQVAMARKRSPVTAAAGGGSTPSGSNNSLLPPQLGSRKNIPTEDLSNHFKDSTRRKYNSSLTKKPSD